VGEGGGQKPPLKKNVCGRSQLGCGGGQKHPLKIVHFVRGGRAGEEAIPFSENLIIYYKLINTHLGEYTMTEAKN
jgi:hypothetical protein